MTATVSAKQIEDLRRMFLDFLRDEGGGDASLHPADLERVHNNDDWLRRFLMHSELNTKEAIKMMDGACKWRKDFNVNEFSLDNLKTEYLYDGLFFPYGQDKDGCTLLVFKSKKHFKGKLEFEELKKCVVYWLERLERANNGRQLSIFFDMDGCGMANMDLEFTKYLINLFKYYYPYYLNYIIIYEMPWMMNAALKIIKSWLPEKAVQKIKSVNKSTLKDYVAPEVALKCWGGQADYTFSFEPESPNASNTTTTTATASSSTASKKVHFADGQQQGAAEGGDGNELILEPQEELKFTVGDDCECSSSLTITNADASVTMSYKMKTTSPEKYRVRPSCGLLAPGERASITVTVLPAYAATASTISRDKFMVLSMPVRPNELHLPLPELWKEAVRRGDVTSRRLRCAPLHNISNVAMNGALPHQQHHQGGSVNTLEQLSKSVQQLEQCHGRVHRALRRTEMLQWLTLALTVLLGAALLYVVRQEVRENGGAAGGACFAPKN